jgi:hypothetical protein
MRDSLLTELGALVMEMHRQRRHNPALVERKANEALFVDREARGLARALGTHQSVREVVAAGIVGGCPACGALLATDDRFCARCGTPTAARNGVRAPAPGTASAWTPAPGAAAAPAPTPGTAATPPPAPNLAARVAGQARPTAAPPPPAPGTRVARAPAPLPPPDPGSRAPAPKPAIPPDAAPPPDPTTRVRPPDATDATVQIATGSTSR